MLYNRRYIDPTRDYHLRQKIANASEIAIVSEIRTVLAVLLYSIYYIIDICRSH